MLPHLQVCCPAGLELIDEPASRPAISAADIRTLGWSHRTAKNRDLHRKEDICYRNICAASKLKSIEIMREVFAEFKRPVMLYSIGKDSSVMLHIAIKAFYPANAFSPASR